MLLLSRAISTCFYYLGLVLVGLGVILLLVASFWGFMTLFLTWTKDYPFFGVPVRRKGGEAYQDSERQTVERQRSTAAGLRRLWPVAGLCLMMGMALILFGSLT